MRPILPAPQKRAYRPNPPRSRGRARYQIFPCESRRTSKKKEAEEAALLTEQQRQAEAEQQQRYEDMQTSIASLQAEKKDTLEEKKLRENQKALSDEQNTTQSLKELLEDRNLLVENKALTYLQDTKELQTTIATLQAKIEENEQAYEMLTYQAGELENLLSEQQIINSELQTIMNENEAEHASEVASLRAAHEQRLRELQNTIESLQTDNTILTSQLEEKTQSLEERLSLEQQRMDEVKRQEEERQALQKKNAEEQRRAEEAENARLAALEAEYQQIPPLSQLTLPSYTPPTKQQNWLPTMIS